MPSCERSSVAAKPQQPKASTRMPMPSDSPLPTCAGFAVLGGDLAVARLHRADVGVGDAAAGHGVERAEGEVLHRGVIRPPSLSCSPDAVRGKRVE